MKTYIYAFGIFTLRALVRSLPVVLVLVGGLKANAITINVDYLVVAGGGGGGAGAQSSNNGGGGGGGGFLTGTDIGVTGIVPVVVGAGGLGGSNPQVGSPTRSTNGGNSQFDTITALGGGAGGGGTDSLTPGGDTFHYLALSGGSGGGGAVIDQTAGAAGTPGQGNAGSNGVGLISPFQAGGGGGAGEAGGTDGLGFGGDGLSSDINGITTFYAGGGGGGRDFQVSPGGDGGGGASGYGQNPSLLATAGVANSGGGGGGGGSQGVGMLGADGGSGTVILRYLVTTDLIRGIGGTESFANIDGQYYHLHTYSSVGAFNFTVVPEPGTFGMLLVGGLFGRCFMKRRRV